MLILRYLIFVAFTVNAFRRGARNLANRVKQAPSQVRQAMRQSPSQIMNQARRRMNQARNVVAPVRRQAPRPAPIPVPAPLPRVPDLDLGPAPQSFGNLTSASTKQKIDWYKYMGKIFWRAGYYRGLNRLYEAVRRMSVPPESPDYAAWMKVMQKLDRRMSLAQPLMNHQTITDRMALDVTDLLLTQGYPEAVEYLKRLRREGSLTIPSDDMNALTLSAAMIRFDSIFNRPVVPLWEYFWKLTLTEKMDIMAFATRYRENPTIPADPKVRNVPAIIARLRVIMGEKDIDGILRTANIPNQVEPLMIRAYAKIVNGDHCAGARLFEEAAKAAPVPQIVPEIRKKASKYQRYCKKSQTTKTYSAFCQSTPGTEFPISDAAKGESSFKSVASSERLFWTAVWAGDCRAAFEQMTRLKRNTSVSFLASHPIVNTRISYMEQTLTECNANNQGTFESPEGRRVWGALISNNPSEALRMARETNNPMLMFAALVFRYPKAAYSPCMGGAVITGAADLPTLELVHRITTGEVLPDCGYGNDECNYRQLQAFYITGSLTDAKRLAGMMTHASKFCRPTVQMLGCLELCTNPNNKDNMRAAVKHFNKLLETSQAQPALKIAKHLAEKLRDAPPQTSTTKSATSVEKEAFGQDMPMPSMRQRAPQLGSCAQKTCGSAGFPCQAAARSAPCPVQAATPCQQAAQAPIPAPSATATTPQTTPVAPNTATQTQPTPAKPCSCSEKSSSLPINPTTGKPWTGEEIDKVRSKEQKKQEEEAAKIAAPLISKKVAAVCDQTQKRFNDLLDQAKANFNCPECEKAREEALKAEAIALANGTAPAKPDAAAPTSQAAQ